ncbi:MAG: aldo/keto reductase [Anaerolineales bacterium]
MSAVQPTRRLGKAGLEVSVISLGLWAMGGDEWGPTEDNQSLGTIDAALDAGVNFFDTADVYGSGHSEELLGRAMKGRRDRFIVATKIGWRGFVDETQTSAYDSVDKLVAGVESNLARLGTDYVDLLQNHIHKWEPNTEVFLEGFRRLQKAGKVRAYGASSSDFEFVQRFNADGGMATLQIDYSILNRTPEAEIFPYCQQNDIGILVRGPLAMGILAGKFSASSRFPEGDFRQNWIDKPAENTVFLNDLAKVEKLKSLARERSLGQLALQFSITHPAVSVSIPGAKNTQQLAQNLKAAELGPLGAEELAAIDAITPPGGGRRIWPA